MDCFIPQREREKERRFLIANVNSQRAGGLTGAIQRQETGGGGGGETTENKRFKRYIIKRIQYSRDLIAASPLIKILIKRRSTLINYLLDSSREKKSKKESEVSKFNLYCLLPRNQQTLRLRTTRQGQHQNNTLTRALTRIFRSRSIVYIQPILYLLVYVIVSSLNHKKEKKKKKKKKKTIESRLKYSLSNRARIAL